MNDNAPVFTRPLYTVTVTEGASIGTGVTTVQAVDVDLGFNAQVSYLIVEGNIDGKKDVYFLVLTFDFSFLSLANKSCVLSHLVKVVYELFF